MSNPKLVPICGWCMVAIAILHVVLLLPDILTTMPEWVGGTLWSMQNLQLFALQPDNMRNAGAVFWAAIGGPGVLLLILGVLTIHLGRKGIAIPRPVWLLLLIWAILCSLIMQPSGFPFIAAVAIALLTGTRPHAA